MPSPDIATGTNERNKPIASRSGVVWRFEKTMVQGEGIFSPIFEVVRDGFPLDQGFAGFVIPVASPYFRIIVAANAALSTNPGGQLKVWHVQDSGVIAIMAYKWYLQPKAAAAGQGQSVSFFSYECIARRCRFNLVNLGPGPVLSPAQAYRLEITVEG